MDVAEHEGHLHVRLQHSLRALKTPLRLLALSDTHDFHDDMPHPLPQADILVHAGDFTCRGATDEIRHFMEWTDRLLETGTVADVVVVAGNHECTLELKARNPKVLQNQRELKRALADRPHVHYLQVAASGLGGGGGGGGVVRSLRCQVLAPLLVGAKASGGEVGRSSSQRTGGLERAPKTAGMFCPRKPAYSGA